jgi:hypothetical protein
MAVEAVCLAVDRTRAVTESALAVARRRPLGASSELPTPVVEAGQACAQGDSSGVVVLLSVCAAGFATRRFSLHPHRV